VPEVGDTIAGKYRVDRPIGAGGMGTVVAATHLQLGTPVALKFLADKIKGSASSVERFTREARACAALRSEHVCRVTDFGLHDTTPYLAMELLEGIDLARLIDIGPTEPALAVDFVLQACRGLAEAHAHGIVHRDLKPGNLFLSRRPDGMPLVKVLDFGVAKIPLGDDDASLTRTSHVIGSPGYMAPEQLRSSKTVDARADVWALGVILYELISTRHPFHAAAVTEVALKIAMDEPPPLPEAPEGVRAVVARCLAKEPAERFDTVDELAAALAPFALVDRGVAIAAAKRLIETPWERGPDRAPAADPPETATKVDRPRAPRQPDTTHQVGRGEVARPASGSRRLALVAAAGTFALGGLTVFALTRGGGGDDVPEADRDRDAAPMIIAPDAPASSTSSSPPPPPPPPPAEPRARGPRPRPVPEPRAPGGAPRGEGSGEAPRAGSGSTARERADQQLARARTTLRARGLTGDDLGAPGIALQNELARAQRAGDWATAEDAARKLVARIDGIELDRAFVSGKSARLTARLRTTNPTEDVRAQVLQLQGEAKAMAEHEDLGIANTTLNRAFALLPRARARALDEAKPNPFGY